MAECGIPTFWVYIYEENNCFDDVTFFSIGRRNRKFWQTLPAAPSAHAKIIFLFQTAAAED
jgi:hypothetical protein